MFYVTARSEATWQSVNYFVAFLLYGLPQSFLFRNDAEVYFKISNFVIRYSLFIINLKIASVGSSFAMTLNCLLLLLPLRLA